MQVSDGQRGEHKSPEQTAGAGHREAPGRLLWGLQIHGGCSLSPGKVSRYSTGFFYPALHQSEMEPGGSVWSLIQRENSAKPCRVCSPLGCDK